MGEFWKRNSEPTGPDFCSMESNVTVKQAACAAHNLPPDVEFRNAPPHAKFDWIHRRNGELEIYFLSNPASAA